MTKHKPCNMAVICISVFLLCGVGSRSTALFRGGSVQTGCSLLLQEKTVFWHRYAAVDFTNASGECRDIGRVSVRVMKVDLDSITPKNCGGFC